MARVIASYTSMRKGDLDNDYYLYDNGEIMHKYDQNQFKLNQTRALSADDLSDRIKDKLIASASDADRELVEELLNRS